VAKVIPISKFVGPPCNWKNSRWDFWKEGISSSLLSSFLTCREQFRLSVVEGYRSNNVPLSLSFGTCMHWCLEQGYKLSSPPGKAKCQKLISDFEKLWLSERPAASQRQLETQELTYGLADAMLPTYFERWTGDYGPKFKYPKVHNTSRIDKWVGLETRFSVPFRFDDVRETRIVGTRDAMFRTPKGSLRIFDSKCRSIINEEDTQDTLPFDLQQMLYLWATWKETGECPVGTTMNIVRRPGHRRGREEPLRKFLDRVRKEVETPSRWDHYFIRIEMDISKAEIIAWEKSVLRPLMEDVRGWWEGRSPHYINPNALVTKYGRCEMFNIIVYGNTNGFFRRDRGKVMSYQTDLT